MAKENKQQDLPDSDAAVFFLLSQNEPTKHDSAAQTTAFLCRTLQFVVGGITYGQLAPAHLDGDGWFIPARTLLDARLFHSKPNVAGLKRKTGRRTSLQNRLSRAGKYFLKGKNRVAEAELFAPNGGEIEVTAAAESGLDCRIQCSADAKSYENKRICEDFAADAPDKKFRNARQAAGAPGRSEDRRRARHTPPGGGCDGRFGLFDLMGQPIAENWLKSELV
jgi:hypothetical protein